MRDSNRSTEYEFKGNLSRDLVEEQIQIFQELWNLNNVDDQIQVDGVFGTETEYRLSITPLSGFLITDSARFATSACAALSNQASQSYDHNLALQYYKFSKISYCKKNDILLWNCQGCRDVETLSQISVTTLDKYEDDFKDLGFVSYSQQKNLIVISFRGGQLTRNWITNLNAFFRKRLDYCYNCKGHRGYYNAWKELRTEILQSYEILKKKKLDAKLLITGHSIGGAIATFAALDFISRGIVVDELYIFGSPMVGNIQLMEYLQKSIPNTYHIVNQNDIVPHLPYQSSSYQRFIKEIWYNNYQNFDYQTCLNYNGIVDANCFNFMTIFSLTKHYDYFNFNTKCELPFMLQLQQLIKNPWKNVALVPEDKTTIDNIIKQYQDQPNI